MRLEWLRRPMLRQECRPQLGPLPNGKTTPRFKQRNMPHIASLFGNVFWNVFSLRLGRMAAQKWQPSVCRLARDNAPYSSVMPGGAGFHHGRLHTRVLPRFAFGEEGVVLAGSVLTLVPRRPVVRTLPPVGLIAWTLGSDELIFVMLCGSPRLLGVRRTALQCVGF